MDKLNLTSKDQRDYGLKVLQWSGVENLHT